MRVFVDTSAWLALHDRRDQFNEEALAKQREIKEKRLSLVTTEYIFSECVTLIQRRIGLNSAAEFGDSLLTSKIVDLAKIDSKAFIMAWGLFKRSTERDMSFVDCTSFAMMKIMKIKTAFAFDRHFLSFGFTLL
jgi:predicted nucleic acid-binding protein